jgi:hypothetical protein
MVCRFPFGEKTDVFPGQAWFHPHVMDLLVDVDILSSLCMCNCMGGMSIQLLEVSTHGDLDHGKKGTAPVGSMPAFKMIS